MRHVLVPIFWITTTTRRRGCPPEILLLPPLPKPARYDDSALNVQACDSREFQSRLARHEQPRPHRDRLGPPRPAARTAARREALQFHSFAPIDPPVPWHLQTAAPDPVAWLFRTRHRNLEEWMRCSRVPAKEPCISSRADHRSPPLQTGSDRSDTERQSHSGTKDQSENQHFEGLGLAPETYSKVSPIQTRCESTMRRPSRCP